MRRVFHSVAVLPLLLLFFVFGTVYATEYRQIRTEGTGGTLKEAILEALTDAVGQVNGLGIESKKELSSVEVSSADSNNSNYLSSESFRKSIRTATKGVIAAYSVLGKHREPSGRWSVTLQSRVAVYQRPQIAERKKIAVLPLRLSGKAFIIDGVSVNGDAVNRIFGQSLVSGLVQSRRFTVLDRDHVTEILAERKILADGNTPVDQMVRLGQELVADYVVAGTLEEVGLGTRTDTMRQSGRTIISRYGRVEVSYRVIDIDSKQIVWSDFFRMHIGESEIRKLSSSPESNGLESALCQLAAERISRQVLNAIYPVLVVSVSSGEVTLGQGGSGLKVGDRFDVYEYGGRIIDPYTKEFIGRSESYVATVEVVRVNPKQSLARIVRAEKDIVAGFQQKKYVCRAVVVDQAAISERQREIKASERRSAFDREW